MPRTQTTGVVISIAARATMARTELKGLRKDVAEFGNFVRETFRGASATKIKGPTLGGEWRAVQREIHDITTSIEKDINRIAALRLRAPTVGTFLRNSQTNASAAVGAAAVTGAGSGAAAKISRAEEIEQAARLTREFHAGTLEASAYRAELQKIADTAVKGSEKQIDALTRIKRAREQDTAQIERERKAEQKRQDQAAADAKRTAQTAQRQQFGTPFAGGRIAAGAGIARNVGDAMTVGVTLPIVATFAAATKSAMGFETAMRNVNSIAQLSEKDFQALYQSVLKVAADPSIKQGPEELAKGLYELESSGFHGQKALDLLAVSSKGATAGLSTTKTASEVLIGVLNSGIPGVTSAQQAMDVLFKTVDLGKVNFTELSVNLGKVLPTAAKAGITLQQLTGAIAAMTIQGASAAQASTGLLNLINKIANPSKQAEKEFRRLGISYGYVGLQAKGLPGILEEINRKTGGHGDAIKRLLPDMRAQRAALQLINGDVKKYNEFTGEMNHANDGVGATQKALNEQMKALSFQIDKLVQQFQIIAARIGPSLLRALSQILKTAQPFADKVADLADAFIKLNPEQQKWVLGLIAAAAAIGPLLSGFGRFAGGANEMIRLFQTLSPLIGGTGTAVAGLGTSAAAATGEVTALAAALTALSALGIITVGVIATIAAYKYIGKPLAEAVGGLMDQDQNRKFAGTGVSDAQRAANKYRPFAVGGQAVDENTKGDIYQAYDRQRRALPMTNGVVDWTAAAKDLYAAADKLSKLVLKPDSKLIARMRDQREIDNRYNADKTAADREAAAKAANPGVVQPAVAGGTGTKFHTTRPHVPRADTINAGAVVNDLTDQYGTAFGKYTDRSDRMSAGDRKKAEQGLMALANRIQVAQEKEAKAAEDRVNLTSTQNRAEAAKAKAAATTQAEAQRAEDMIAAADAADADAAATYTAAMKRIRNEHSERYRKIYQNQEKTAEQLGQEAAKDQEQALQIEAEKHDERIAAIDEQLKTTQDTTDRQKLLNEKYDEMDAAAKARFEAAKVVAGAIDNPREQKRALTQAGADYTNSSNDIARQRRAAGLENDQQRLENEIRLHQIAADNTDDLIVKYRELKAVQDANLELMKSQGAPQILIDAQKAANEREQRAGQAEIAHGNAQTAFVQAATSGVGSFASGSDSGAEGLRKQLRGFFESEFANTEQSAKGRVANEQFDTIVKAVQSNAVTLDDMLPLIRDVETRINASGSIDAAGNFARAFKSFFSSELADTFQKYDNEKNKAERAAQYNQLIAGIKSGSKFAGLSDGERRAVVKTVEEKRDKRPDSDGKHHSYQQIGDEAVKAISESADRHSGEFVAGLFGNAKKAKAAAEDFWKEVAETGKKSLARAADEALLKPIAKRITAGLANVFQNGAGGFEGVLGRATASMNNIFKQGVAGIAQAAVYLQGVMALAGQGGGGRRGKKGSAIGAALGLGVGLLTGGAGMALVGASLTGASAGSQVAQGNYLGAALSVGTSFMPGGAFAGGGGGMQINKFGGVGNQPYGPPVPKALGGAASRGMHYQVNEDRAWIGKEAFIPSVDGMILPSATAISRLPTVAAANNSLLSELRDMIHGGGAGGKNPNFTLNNYGDQYTEADSDRMLRSWGRNVRDKMTR